MFGRDKRPWYATGLAFECRLCGRCCCGPDEGYVWVTEEEIAAIARHLGITPARMRELYVRKVDNRHSLKEKRPSNDCIFYRHDPDASGDGEGASGQCLIYEVRPAQCRSWPFWPSNLTDPDAWAIAGMRCKGINRGRLHTCDEIEAKRKATRE